MFFKQLIVMILYLEKLYYRYFLTQIISALSITTFSKFSFVPFCVRALHSLTNYSFFMNSVFEKAPLSIQFYTKNTPLSLVLFFSSKFLSLYSFPTFCGSALRA